VRRHDGTTARQDTAHALRCPTSHPTTDALWPTLVFLRDGQEVARLVRPQDAAALADALARLAPAA